MKTCTTCHRLKPLDEFNVMRRSSDGRQPRCRDCCRAWYLAHADQHKVNTARRKQQVYAENRQRLREYFAEHPCVDCGEDDLRVLEFDHRDGVDKTGDVSLLLREGRNWRRIVAEMAKCDVRCCNCHRRRTSEQFDTWRAKAWRADRGGIARSPSERLARLLPTPALSST